MSVEYTLAPEVELMAKGMVEGFMDHSHLKEAKITYVFGDKAPSKGDGRVVLGKAKNRNALDKLLSPKKEDFIVVIYKDRWEKMTDVEKRALVDHELCHCGNKMDAKGATKFALRGHIIEEFPENLGRFEHRRILLGSLIQNPPSALDVKQESRKVETPEGGEEE